MFYDKKTSLNALIELKETQPHDEDEDLWTSSKFVAPTENYRFEESNIDNHTFNMETANFDDSFQSCREYANTK